MAGKFDRFWEMRQGGPGKKKREIFKCTECGGETHPARGFNGEPNINNCRSDCGSRSDWNPGVVSRAYKDNFDRVFRNGSRHDSC